MVLQLKGLKTEKLAVKNILDGERFFYGMEIGVGFLRNFLKMCYSIHKLKNNIY